MNHHYADIRKRIPEEPSWFDEHAVPRYVGFSPRETANIYAREAVLLHIECQNCGRPFRVCMTSDSTDEIMKRESLAKLVERQAIHYGDPPNVGCCPSGPTMNSVPRRVLEFWRDAGRCTWERVPELEVAIEPDWASDDEPASLQSGDVRKDGNG